MDRDLGIFIGKTLREVRALHTDVRVRAAGSVAFRGTCEVCPNRLNVTLGGEDLRVVNKPIKVAGKEVQRQVIENIDDGVVLTASWG